MKIPGPFIGVVMNNLDPTYMGRLQVWIPELSGGLPPEDKTTWFTVGYAPPFYGVTNLNYDKSVNSSNTSQSYGMWFVPPDLGVQVMVAFVNNDPARGYWFACVPSQLLNYMVPGIAGRKAVAPDAATNEPVTEYNKCADAKTLTGIPGAATLSDPNLTPPHLIQQSILQTQGLDKDDARGPSLSTARREVPSSVFGISTPGPAVSRKANSPTESAQAAQDFLTVTARYGGHQFVMDDGNALGQSQMIKLRSSQGGTIMINDTIGSIYVINQNGTGWIEITANGRIDVYGKGSISLHSEQDINLTADNDININASNNLNMVASQINSDANAQLHHSKSQFYIRGPDVILESDSLSFIAKAGAGNGEASKNGSGLSIVADSGNMQFVKFDNDGKPVLGQGGLDIQSFTGKITMQSVTGLELKSLENLTLHSQGRWEIYAKGGIYEDLTALPTGFGSMFALVETMALELKLITAEFATMLGGVDAIGGLLTVTAGQLQVLATEVAGYVPATDGLLAALALTPAPSPGTPLNPGVAAGAQTVGAELGALATEVAVAAGTVVSTVPNVLNTLNTSITSESATINAIFLAYSLICNWHAGVTAKIAQLTPNTVTSAVVPIPTPYINDTSTGPQQTNVPIVPQHEPWAGHDIHVSANAGQAPPGSKTGDAVFPNGKGMAFPNDTTNIVSGAK